MLFIVLRHLELTTLFSLSTIAYTVSHPHITTLPTTATTYQRSSNSVASCHEFRPCRSTCPPDSPKYVCHTQIPPSVVNSPSPSTENTYEVQHIHQVHLNMLPISYISGCNTHAPTPSPGNESQASNTQSDYIDRF